jgi:sigma-B regulation protein RsbU (phosphoserine phosphatase)
MTDRKDRILVVDDERLNVEVLVNLLRDDYRMMVGKNGAQAMKAVQSSTPPDLVLLDIMMPEMDGYEVCRRIKADAQTRDIPVIFVSAMGEESDETKGLDIGAVDYITKPVSPGIVRSRVRTHLAVRHQMQEIARASAVIEVQRKRMHEELELARSIQTGMMPDPCPTLPGVDLKAMMRPARELGGDFYDFFPLADGRLCICIGDVAGKGAGAALFMAATRSIIRSKAASTSSPAEIMTYTSDELARGNESCTFVTLWFGIVDQSSGEIVFTNAGHNPPYVCRSDGSVEMLRERHGPVAGAWDGFEYGDGTLTLGAGDLLFLYTDGVNEAFDPAGVIYTDKRLESLLRELRPESAADAVEGVTADVWRHQAEAEQSDDVTVLALRVTR